LFRYSKHVKIIRPDLLTPHFLSELFNFNQRHDMLRFMRNKILIPSLILVALAVFFSFKYANDREELNGGQNEIIQNTIMGIISQGHYSPRDIDDNFSRSVFDKMLESFDYDKKFFLQSDIDSLKTFRDKIDDEIRDNSLDFFNQINTLFVNRIAQAQTYYQDLLSRPFDFNGKDQIELDGKKLQFVKDEAGMKARWNAYLKYRVLEKYKSLKDAEEKKAKDSTGYQMRALAALEQEARENVLKVQDRYFKRLQKLNDNDRFAIYMNTICGTEDPHTNYLPPDDKKKFDEMMSGSFSGIGATLQQQDDGSVKITSIVTGSPAWKGGKLKADDVIEKVAQGDAMPIDAEGFDLEDVVKMIRGPKGTEVRLTVKHSDGSSEVISIIRDKVDIEDIFAKSNIVEEDGKRIGYIYLPEFYVDFNNPKGRRCSTDIEKELIKLKAAQVDGIILDLRNNGGGSLPDVVDIAGLFIGKGPVVQVRSSGNQTMTLSSKLNAPLYSGPLAIMVNGGSASASEILAAAMQDYGRAVIVGSTTFGKGTVQKLVPLDQFVTNSARQHIIESLVQAKGGDAEYDGIGSLKLTIQKFYRINGGSTQLKGVTPDILLPDVYDMLDETGERKDKSALQWDKIASVSYPTFQPENFYSHLSAKSRSRVSNSANFKLILEAAQKLKKQQDDNVMPLNEAAYADKLKENEALSKRIDQLDSLNTPLSVQNLEEDLAKINLDSASVNKNKAWIKRLEKDPYIAETVTVINDWMNNANAESTKKKALGKVSKHE